MKRTIAFGIILLAFVDSASAQQITHQTTQDTAAAETALSNCMITNKQNWAEVCANAGVALQRACEHEGNSKAACEDVVKRDVIDFAPLEH
jgi:hypothetical protein